VRPKVRAAITSVFPRIHRERSLIGAVFRRISSRRVLHLARQHSRALISSGRTRRKEIAMSRSHRFTTSDPRLVPRRDDSFARLENKMGRMRRANERESNFFSPENSMHPRTLSDTAVSVLFLFRGMADIIFFYRRARSNFAANSIARACARTEATSAENSL